MSSEPSTGRFLGLPPPLSRRDRARFHVLPVPYEGTVTYGQGTARGPEAILVASEQVELFDGVSVPAESGIHTHRPLAVQDEPPAAVISQVQRRVAGILEEGGTPVVLGGEHTVMLGAVAATAAAAADVGVVQLDAHADLRDVYDGTPYSHACVMRRVYELGLPIFQIGVRSCCLAEARFRAEHGIGRLDAVDIAMSGVPAVVIPDDFPADIHITFDVDAFDPSVIPATGTPEPGGLFWYDVLRILSAVVRGRRVLSFDVVELAPVRGLHASDFTAARLVYALMGLIVRDGRLCQ